MLPYHLPVLHCRIFCGLVCERAWGLQNTMGLKQGDHLHSTTYITSIWAREIWPPKTPNSLETNFCSEQMPLQQNIFHHRFDVNQTFESSLPPPPNKQKQDMLAIHHRLPGGWQLQLFLGCLMLPTPPLTSFVLDFDQLHPEKKQGKRVPRSTWSTWGCSEGREGT